MKPYQKGIKLAILMLFLILGTFYFIRKKDELASNINNSVKNNLIVDKSYVSINISPIRKVSKKDISKFHHLYHSQNVNDQSLLTVDHKFRINDTLYTVQVFINKNKDVIAVDKPIKVSSILD